MHVTPAYRPNLARLGNIEGDHKGRVIVRIPGTDVSVEADSDNVTLMAEGGFVGLHVVRDDGSTWTCYGPVVVEDAPKPAEPEPPAPAEPEAAAYGSLASLAGG